ncbi:TetR/AcrR family transcriptional regulator [Aeromicrobium sp. CF3.5]|uniref:TetR/AcrR family transcriptional regulator n=1 Tax=Aeromicrobium sp. CF3.5 TaxID=3373078 RepID=UPI003EE778E1
MDRKPGRPRALTVDQIAQAALDDGVNNFSMPSVARRLGVAHSGLYRYVADRESLLITAVDRAVNTIEWPDADQPWDDLLRAIGDSMWELCDNFPGLDRASLSASRAAPSAVKLIEGYVAQLHREGFSLEDSALAISFVVNQTMMSSADMVRVRANGHSTMVGSDSELLKAYDADEAHSDRGWYTRKLQIILTGLASMRIA